MNFKNNIIRLKDSLKKAKQYGLGNSENSNVLDYKEQKKEAYNRLIISSLDAIKKDDLYGLDTNEKNKEKINEIKDYVKDFVAFFEKNKIDELLDSVEKVISIYDSLDIIDKKKFELDFGKIPFDIKEEVKADFNELEKCFNSGCYRSAIILCGRILEVVLHRKYYEISGVDALEKSPGIGLGKLIAKLMDKNVKFDPGVTQQIHLVNQVRVGSVHKKKEIFNPTIEQTQAMVLFMKDIVNKLF